MNITIRDARSDDLERVFELMLEFMRAEDVAAANNDCMAEARRRKPAFEADARRELLREFEDDSRFFIAESDGSIIAYARGEIIDRDDAFFAKVRIGMLHALVVSEQHRGQGISSQLAATLESWFRENGCVWIETDVLEHNAAIDVYRHWGFKAVNHTLLKRL